MTDPALRRRGHTERFGGTSRTQQARAPQVIHPGLASGSSPEVLHSIRDPQISLAIWQRNLPMSIQRRMAALCVLMPRQQRFTLAPATSAAATDRALDEALQGFLRTPLATHDPWRADLHLLLTLARDLAPRAPLRVCIETRACEVVQEFHTDHVALRLICAYRGQGTQWLPATEFHCHGLASKTNDQVRDESALQEIPGGAVAVMKGNRFPDQPGHGLLHRSPPAGVDAPRVLAMVDIDLA